MGISKSYSDLTSVATRAKITGNNSGIRKLDFTGIQDNTQSSGSNWLTNTLQNVTNIFKGFGGFLLGGLNFIGVKFSFSNALNWLNNIKNKLMNFDWNMSDQAIQKAIDTKWVQWGGVLGGFVGQVVGWGLSYGVAKAVIGAINPYLAIAVTSSLKSEALEELSSELRSFLSQTATLASDMFWLATYKNTRWLADKIAEKMGHDKPDRSKPLIFNRELEKARIKIFGDDNTFMGNFAEEFFEEAGEAIFEAGMVVANDLDSYFASKRQANYVVEIKPDKESDEIIKIVGSESEIEKSIPQLFTQLQVIGNRDVGIVTGLDDADLQAKIKPSEIIVTIVFYNKPKPPYSEKAVKLAGLGDKLIKREYSVCEVDRSKLDWNTIKMAAGGSNGFTTGEILCKARLNNGRRMMCLGGSQGEAQQIVESLCRLSKAEILYPLSFTERRGFSQSKAQINRRDSIKMYPAYMVLNTQNLIAPNNNSFGNKFKAGQYLKRKARVALYTDNAPSDWDTILKNLFKLTDSD